MACFNEDGGGAGGVAAVKVSQPSHQSRARVVEYLFKNFGHKI